MPNTAGTVHAEGKVEDGEDDHDDLAEEETEDDHAVGGAGGKEEGDLDEELGTYRRDQQQ